MTIRIQISGFAGMLGHAVLDAVNRREHEALGLSDILHVTARDIEGEVVINCAGITKGRLLPASQYMLVNAYGPQRLAEACDSARVRMIHISTDCVFNDTHGPHSESASPTPTDTYSLSKLSGEVTRPPNLTVRTSFIGWGKRGLLNELYAKRGQAMECYAGQRWSGHTVETLADVLVTLAERDDIDGLLHIPGEYQTRGELMRRLSKRFNLDVTVKESIEQPGYDRRLTSERWESLGLPALPSFDSQLEGMQEL